MGCRAVPSSRSAPWRSLKPKTTQTKAFFYHLLRSTYIDERQDKGREVFHSLDPAMAGNENSRPAALVAGRSPVRLVYSLAFPSPPGDGTLCPGRSPRCIVRVRLYASSEAGGQNLPFLFLLPPPLSSSPHVQPYCTLQVAGPGGNLIVTPILCIQSRLV